jgi:hypothetical protein
MVLVHGVSFNLTQLLACVNFADYLPETGCRARSHSSLTAASSREEVVNDVYDEGLPVQNNLRCGIRQASTFQHDTTLTLLSG